MRLHGIARQVNEWSFRSGKSYASPFRDVHLDVIVEGPTGDEWRLPAFWAGEQEWRVRFAPQREGTYRFRTVCCDIENKTLHSVQGFVEVEPYRGENPLLLHGGGLRVSDNKRYLEHSDGTPFFWLADTWWMGLSDRLSWPAEFNRLAVERRAKGFTVIQLVAGLFPDMAPLDIRSKNEAGLPWEPGFLSIRPSYFDMADLRIDRLVAIGLVPCILGCWGYYLPFMGREAMQLHWRYLIARYGAYPIVWCLAGETAMPYYLSTEKEKDKQAQVAGWTELAHYVRKTDPFGRLITTHPVDSARTQLEDPTLLDFNMLQTGHNGYDSIPNTVKQMEKAVHQEPPMPVVNAEVCYEGILGASKDDIQRSMFWSCMLLGAAGHTYGANGVWQVNRADKPFGASPHGATWGNTSWEEAYQLPGSTQVGLGKRILEKLDWWRCEPHPEWIEPAGGSDFPRGPFIAGVPGEFRIAYLPVVWGRPVVIKGLEENVSYKASFFDPRTGNEHPVDVLTPGDSDAWQVPIPPTREDWVLVLVAEKGSRPRS